MPFNQLRHRPSFPPTQIHLSPSSHILPANTNSPAIPEEIDENPISFFLTAPDEDFDFDFPSPEYDDMEDLSAGIEGSPESKSLEAVREVSPSSLQRSRLPEIEQGCEPEGFGYADIDGDEEDVVMFGVGIPLSLRDFTRMSSSPPSGNWSTQTQTQTSTSTSPGQEGRGLGISLSSSPPSRSRRGRPQVRLAPAGNPRGRARSLTAVRPQSWRVPSPDIWSIEEEMEDRDGTERFGEVALRATGRGMDNLYSSSAPVASAMVKAGERKDKVKKRVHWAF